MSIVITCFHQHYSSMKTFKISKYILVTASALKIENRPCVVISSAIRGYFDRTWHCIKVVGSSACACYNSILHMITTRPRLEFSIYATSLPCHAMPCLKGFEGAATETSIVSKENTTSKQQTRI
ncbi:hypothetical protein KC19_4G056300 [Ceratodon purpureus]|uniref:Uncharacterized protein n=1 Tax=Ceratodon purpureus TaxID=3225 RepID=A0A8T0I7C0_CERPU|nr:hypothetical protein KC19_4G056300 [Ceratodon purpureus]